MHAYVYVTILSSNFIRIDSVQMIIWKVDSASYKKKYSMIFRLCDKTPKHFLIVCGLACLGWLVDIIQFLFLLYEIMIYSFIQSFISCSWKILTFMDTSIFLLNLLDVEIGVLFLFDNWLACILSSICACFIVLIFDIDLTCFGDSKVL